MKSWFKTFGLSFFSDRIAGEAAKYGFAIIFLSLLLSFVFFMTGYYAADVVPFSTHYGNAQSYRQFIDGAFTDGGISFSIVDGKAVSGNKVNTYAAEEDGQKYAANGYNLIVDTRPSDTLIEFTQVAVRDETELDYETYLGLSDTDKRNYKLETRYSDKELELTDEAVSTYAAYLADNEDAKEGYEALDKNAADYGKQVYYMYVKYYYTSVSSVYGSSKAPVLRDYYYNNYVTNGNSCYLYLFGDMIAGSFKTDKGLPVVFGGYFTKCGDGEVKNVHSFIKDVYYDTAGYTFTSYFVSAMSQLPMLIFIPLLIGLIMWAAGKAVKNGWVKSFSGCYKIVGSFVWFAALLTALITFVCGFFTVARRLYALMPVMFLAVLVIRTVIYCTVAAVKNRKRLAAEEQRNNNDIFGGIL